MNDGWNPPTIAPRNAERLQQDPRRGNYLKTKEDHAYPRGPRCMTERDKISALLPSTLKRMAHLTLRQRCVLLNGRRGNTNISPMGLFRFYKSKGISTRVVKASL